MSNPVTEARRLRAYELYLQAGLDGKRRSLRSIAQELGVQLPTIQWYRKKDDWDAKLAAALGRMGESKELLQSSVRMQLRKAVVSGIDQLEAIMRKGENDQHRVLAFRELVSAALKLSALDGAAGSAVPDFEDDLTWQGSTSPTAAASPTSEAEPTGASASASPEETSSSTTTGALSSLTDTAPEPPSQALNQIWEETLPDPDLQQ